MTTAWYSEPRAYLLTILVSLVGRICAQVPLEVEQQNNLVEGTIQLLSNHMRSRLSSKMQTVRWESNVALDKLPRAWASAVGGAPHTTHQHYSTWSAGVFAGICYHAPQIEGTTYVTAVYYDGVQTLELLPRADYLSIKRGFRSGAVTIWPHFLLGIMGGEPLFASLQLAMDSKAVATSRVSDEAYCITASGSDYVKKVIVAVKPLLHVTEIHHLLADSSPGVAIIVTAWQDEAKQLPSRAIVRHYVRAKELLDPEDAGAAILSLGDVWVDQHVVVDWQPGERLTGDWLLGCLQAFDAVSYEGQPMATSSGYQRILQREATALGRRFPGRVAMQQDESAPDCVPSAMQVEQMWTASGAAPGRWPQLSSWETGRWPIKLQQAGATHCGHAAVSLLGAVRGGTMRFADMLAAFPENVLSVEQVLRLGRQFNCEVVALRMSNKESAVLRYPFIKCDDRSGPGHASVGIPLEDGEQAIWTGPGVLVLRRPQALDDVMATFLVDPRDSRGIDKLAGMKLAGAIALIALSIALACARIRKWHWAAMALGLLLLSMVVGCTRIDEEDQRVVILPTSLRCEFERPGESRRMALQVENKSSQRHNVRVVEPGCGCIHVAKGEAQLACGEAASLHLDVQATEAGRQERVIGILVDQRPYATVSIVVDVAERIYSRPRSVLLTASRHADVLEDVMEVVVDAGPTEKLGLELASSRPEIVPFVAAMTSEVYKSKRRDRYRIGLSVSQVGDGPMVATMTAKVAGGRAGVETVAVPVTIQRRD